MPIEFACSGCRKVLRVADSAAGKKARCPDCSTVSDVPQASQPTGTAPDFSSFGSSPGAGSTAGPSTPSWSAGNWSPEPNQPAGNPPAGNPFAQQPTPGDSSANNPFASPQPNLSSAPLMGLDEIREKVKGPAICLIVVSGIGVALTFASLAFQMLAGAGMAFGGAGNNGGGAGPAELMVMMTVGIIPAFIQLARAGFMIYGALQMKNLENHSMAMAMAIMAVVPCFSTCCLLDLPFGIWALIVLNDVQVKQGFEQAKLQRG